MILIDKSDDDFWPEIEQDLDYTEGDHEQYYQDYTKGEPEEYYQDYAEGNREEYYQGE